MRKRGYLNLTPEERRARRITFSGVALLIMPPLLTMCHMKQFLCQASWHGGVEQIISLWPMFPWMTTIAAPMLAGSTLATAGGVLMLVATKRERFSLRGMPQAPMHICE
jgi:hypothetical protein